MCCFAFMKCILKFQQQLLDESAAIIIKLFRTREFQLISEQFEHIATLPELRTKQLELNSPIIRAERPGVDIRA